MTHRKAAVPIERVERAILIVRGYKVMLDEDLAALYGEQTKALIQAVRRNDDRFPSDFMFQLEKQDVTNLRSQIGASSFGGPDA